MLHPAYNLYNRKFHKRHIIAGLKSPVTIMEKRSDAQEPFQENQWIDLFNVFAEISPLSETKYATIDQFSFGQLSTENYFVFKIRYKSEVSNNMRLAYKNRIFEIKRIINPYERDKVLQIIALEITE